MRKYKTFNFEIFKVSLLNALGSCSVDSDDFNPISTCTLDQYSTKRKSGLHWINTQQNEKVDYRKS